VHQYGTYSYGRQTPFGLQGLGTTLMAEQQHVGVPAHDESTCVASSGAFEHVRIIGIVAAWFTTASSEECCAKVSSKYGHMLRYGFWVYERGNCSVVSMPTKGQPAIGVTSGYAVVPFNSSDVVDLIDYSCLNGWTMGNVATTPLDMVKFWHALLVDRSLLLPATLAQMMDFHQFSSGFSPGAGAGYGLGLMSVDQPMPVNGRCPPPLCICNFMSCTANITVIGHMGMDWGSAMNFNGYVPQLGASVSMTTNALQGLNSSLFTHENQMLLQMPQCLVLDAIYTAKFPDFPGLNCERMR
jgi:CubicO group peptidase (beta-lactamase class C family)